MAGEQAGRLWWGCRGRGRGRQQETMLSTVQLHCYPSPAQAWHLRCPSEGQWNHLLPLDLPTPPLPCIEAALQA